VFVGKVPFDVPSTATTPPPPPIVQFGYGDGDEVTVVNYGTNVGAKFTTTYFRHYVTVTAGYAGFAATLDLLRDDGATVGGYNACTHMHRLRWC
jgi:hypothetical protein